MDVYIPSMSRWQRSLTLEALAPEGELVGPPGRHKVWLVVPTAQAAQYGPLAARHGARVMPCPVRGIAATRHYIGLKAQGPKFLMLDDDLRFFYRTVDTGVRLWKCGTLDMEAMLEEVDEALDRYAHCAISAREGNNNLPFPVEINNRPLRALAYQTEWFLKCRHGRVKIMEDFDVTLQLIGMGKANAIITNFAQDQVQTQMAGGCSDYRTHELHEQSVLKMAELHGERIFRVRQKQNKGGGEFGTRTEATIYWKKAYDIATGRNP